LNNISEKIIKI